MSRRRGSLILRAIIGVALLISLGFSGLIQWSALLGLIESWRDSLTALTLLLAGQALVAWRFCVLLRAQGLELGFGSSVRLTLIGAFFNAFLPGAAGGDVARAYLAARPNAGHRTEIATIVLLDRAVGFLALLTLPLFIAWALGSSHEWPASITALLRFAGIGALVFSVAILTSRSHGPLRRTLIRVLGWVRLDGYAERFFDTLYAFRHRQTAILSALLISFLVQALMVTALVLLARAVGARPLGWGLVIVVPFGMLANSLPITPGGLGVGEAAFAALFWAIGATGGAETILAWRVLTTLIDLAGGALLVAGHTDMSMVAGMTAGVETNGAPSAPTDGAAEP